MWTANLFLYRDMSVYLQEPHSKRRAGQSFSNCGLKITYIVWGWTSSLSVSVNRQINREWQLFLLSNMQQKKGLKRIEMIIKMVNKFILTVVHFARPNPPSYPASLFPLKGLCHPTRMREPMKRNLKKTAQLFQVVSEILEGCFYLSKSQSSFDS